MGDLNPSKHFDKPGYAVGPIYRYNFEPRNSIRLSAIYNFLYSDANGYGNDYIEELSLLSFDATFVDIAAVYEFNFIPYKTANRKLKKSLYISGGMAYNVNLSGAQSHFSIPFGIGYKLNVAKKLSVGAEVSVRKTFSDTAIDGVHNVGSENNNLVGNNDWYTFAGIFISYKIFNYREDCPAYD